MCTLTLISVPSNEGPAGLRVVMNRDELRSRPEGIPPRWREVRAGLRVTWPTDPQAGGTWVAATSDGLVLCLLNLNLRPPVRMPEEPVSRGHVIPRVLERTGGRVDARSLRGIGLEQFAPFRLIIAGRGEPVRELQWDGIEATGRMHAHLPVCFVSSGLGDEVVRPRLELFRSQLVAGCDAAAQDRFHQHAWVGRPEISVRMSRADARTVSVTTVEVEGPLTRPVVRMAYEAIPATTEGASGKALAVAGVPSGR
jgi:hypothetical protein